MKKIYIVLTHTGTLLSRIIKYYTKDEFSHSSLALDFDLNEMYSFGRLNPYNPFWGGFVHERINRGTFKRFYKTETTVYSMFVTDEQYKKLQDLINFFENTKDKYKFNVIGLFAAGFHQKIGSEHSFYCAEFVKYLLDEAGIETNLPEVIKPEDFKFLSGVTEVYSGKLKDYRNWKKSYLKEKKEKLEYYFNSNKIGLDS